MIGGTGTIDYAYAGGTQIDFTSITAGATSDPKITSFITDPSTGIDSVTFVSADALAYEFRASGDLGLIDAECPPDECEHTNAR